MLTTTSEKIFELDFIDFTFKEHLLESNEHSCVILSSTKEKQVFLINKRSSKIIKCDLHDFSIIEKYKKESSSKVNCFLFGEEKNLIILGHANGDLDIIDSERMELVDTQNFEDKEKGKLHIEAINLVGNFIIAAFTNGLLSIIGKIWF